MHDGVRDAVIPYVDGPLELEGERAVHELGDARRSSLNGLDPQQAIMGEDDISSNAIRSYQPWV
ncbi:hypothetical protein [Collinsella intestinalis]|uniref:hypothetical protein n=1 Tax=Collinsella intestinalis TaxID=147207 RepID=UPI0025A41F1B|nr:hypothetical protein [Collinsella intestinalis]